MDASGLPWFALQVRSNSEKITSTILRNKGFEEFSPTYRLRRRWADRVKYVEQPLFPGYIFCRLDMNSRILPVLTTPTVIRIVGVGKMPVPVDETEIDAIQAITRSGMDAAPCPFLKAGTTVRIKDGPLRGTEGILLDAKDACRLVVSVTLLQRSVSVQLDSYMVSPVKAPGVLALGTT